MADTYGMTVEVSDELKVQWRSPDEDIADNGRVEFISTSAPFAITLANLDKLHMALRIIERNALDTERKLKGQKSPAEIANEELDKLLAEYEASLTE